MAMKGLLEGLTKLFLGVLLAFILLSFAGVATARYFMAKLSVLPPKPSFDNDFRQGQQATEVSSPAAPASPAQAQATPAATATAVPAISPDPPGSYQAVVVQPIGLILRAGAGLEHGQIGGVDYNEELLVLKLSADERWMNVRLDNGQVGWVKAGNTQRLSE